MNVVCSNFGFKLRDGADVGHRCIKALPDTLGNRQYRPPPLSAVWSLSGGGRSRVSSAMQLVVVSFPPKLHVLRSLANTAH
jgi:hypothetical protein